MDCQVFGNVSSETLSWCLRMRTTSAIDSDRCGARSSRDALQGDNGQVPSATVGGDVQRQMLAGLAPHQGPRCRAGRSTWPGSQLESWLAVGGIAALVDLIRCRCRLMQTVPLSCTLRSTTGSTQASQRRRNSLPAFGFWRNRLRSTEPKVTGSSPVGCTSHRVAVSPYAASPNCLRHLAFRALSLAHFATSVGHGDRCSTGFLPGFRCKLLQTVTLSGKQCDTIECTSGGNGAPWGAPFDAAGASRNTKRNGRRRRAQRRREDCLCTRMPAPRNAGPVATSPPGVSGPRPRLRSGKPGP